MTDDQPTWVRPQMDMLRGFYEMVCTQPPEWVGMTPEEHAAVTVDYATFREWFEKGCARMTREDLAAGRPLQPHVAESGVAWAKRRLREAARE